MILAALSVLGVLIILLLAEYISRAKQVHGELTRKFVHMSVGTFVAFWPFFLSWGQIQFLSFAFVVVILLSIKFDIFRSIHAVKRGVSGEILFAVVIGLLAVIATNEWIFMAAMLHLSLADGMAAMVGLIWGDKNQYKFLGETKSIAGSSAFLVTSIAILIVYNIGSNEGIGLITFLWLPLAATLAENAAVRGSDNLFIPLIVALALTGSV